MILTPKKLKYKKVRKGRLSKLEFKTNTLRFGEIGLKTIESGTINSKQIEAARQAIVRKIKRKGKVWIRIFPNLPITSKPTGSRMGKGKGPVSHYVAKLKGGTVIFEICGVSLKTAISALKTGSAKLPTKNRIFI